MVIRGGKCVRVSNPNKVSRTQKEGTGPSKTAVFKNTLHKEHRPCIRIELGTFVA